MTIRVVLADDHPIVMDGLESLFRLEPDFQIVARCQNGDEALHAVRRHRPDVLIVDLRMPKLDGMAVVRSLHEEKLPTRVILLAGAIDRTDALEALRLGVRGMVLKELAPRLLIQCVRKVHAGETWVEKSSVTGALETLLRREAAMREVGAHLTPREIELVRMVAGGLRNRQMAQQLSITEGTVKIHLHNVYQKLKVENRVQLVLYAQSKGLV